MISTETRNLVCRDREIILYGYEKRPYGFHCWVKTELEAYQVAYEYRREEVTIDPYPGEWHVWVMGKAI